MQLVLLSGHSATGKTTVGRELSSRLKYPFYSKDDEKSGPQLADPGLLNWLRHEQTSKEELWQKIGKAMARRTSVVVESNFSTTDRMTLTQLIQEYPDEVEVSEIYLYCNPWRMLSRFAARAFSPERRQEGHRDWAFIPTNFAYACLLQCGIRWPHGPLQVNDRVMELPTDNFQAIDYAALVQFVQPRV